MKTIYFILVVCISLLKVNSQITDKVEVLPGVELKLYSGGPWKTNGDSVFMSNQEIAYVVSGSYTQAVPIGFLQREKSFIFNLFDTNHQVVPKTEAGIKLSLPLNLDEVTNRIIMKHPAAKLSPKDIRVFLPEELGVKHSPISSTSGRIHKLFTPEDCFIMKEKGDYLLQVQLRVWARLTNGGYGVVTSPPLRVKVVKE